MLYEVTYRRDNKDEKHVLTFAAARVLAEYIYKTFRIEVALRRAA